MVRLRPNHNSCFRVLLAHQRGLKHLGRRREPVAVLDLHEALCRCDKACPSVADGFGKACRAERLDGFHRFSRGEEQDRLRPGERRPTRPLRADMGGADATLRVSDSVASMRAAIARLNQAHRGAFLNYDGQPFSSW